MQALGAGSIVSIDKIWEMNLICRKGFVLAGHQRSQQKLVLTLKLALESSQLI